MIEYTPTADEKRNGWTKATLSNYIRDRGSAQENSVYFTKKIVKPARQNNKYNPFKLN